MKYLQFKFLILVLLFQVSNITAQTMTVYTTSGEKYSYKTKDLSVIGFNSNLKSSNRLHYNVAKVAKVVPFASGVNYKFLLTAKSLSNYSLKIFTTCGKLLYKKNGKVTSTGQSIISLPQKFKNGFFIMSIDGKDFNVTRKIILFK